MSISLINFGQSSSFKFHKPNSTDSLSKEYQSIYNSLLPEDKWKKVKFTNECIEMLYYIRNFEDEAKRNGNINWDRGYLRSIRWVRWHLCSNTELFNKEIKKEIKSDLRRLRHYRRPYTNDDIYTRLKRRVIEYQINGNCELY